LAPGAAACWPARRGKSSGWWKTGPERGPFFMGGAGEGALLFGV